LGSKDSQFVWNEKSSTTIVIDFDDTIFPTTWIREDLSLNWRLPIADQVAPSPEREEVETILEGYTEQVTSFLMTASSLAHVALVTLAREPWVDTACENFMPELGELLKRSSIPIIYARDYITPEIQKAHQEKPFRTAHEETDFWMNAKRRAMEDTLRKQYDANDRTWKNIISIGDSSIEQVGLVTCGEEYMKQETAHAGTHVLSRGRTAEFITDQGHHKKLRVKTVKMIDRPTCDELLVQLYLLNSWLPNIINLDEGLDVVIPGADDNDGLNELHTRFTGEVRHFDWMSLCMVAVAGV
jgi:hypothetical protein